MSQDPEEAGVDWGYTGYGTGDPNATGFLSKLGKWMPLIVGGIFTAGTLQSMGLLPGMTSAEAAQADAAIGAGTSGAASAGGIAPGVIANSAPDIGAGFGAAGGGAAGAVGAGAAGYTGLGSAGADAAAGAIPGITLPNGPGGLPGGGVANDLLHALGGGAGIGALATTIPALLASQQAKSPLDNPQIQQLLNMSIARQQRTDPLHQAVTQLSMSMLPTAVQK